MFILIVAGFDLVQNIISNLIHINAEKYNSSDLHLALESAEIFAHEQDLVCEDFRRKLELENKTLKESPYKNTPEHNYI